MSAIGQAGEARASLDEDGSRLPHSELIQASFGRHELGDVVSSVGPSANVPAGQQAFARGNEVGFRCAPSLHVASHEAAHIIQQRKSAELSPRHAEEHANCVADAVCSGGRAEPLIDQLDQLGASSTPNAMQFYTPPREEAGAHADGQALQFKGPVQMKGPPPKGGASKQPVLTRGEITQLAVFGPRLAELAVLYRKAEAELGPLVDIVLGDPPRELTPEQDARYGELQKATLEYCAEAETILVNIGKLPFFPQAVNAAKAEAINRINQPRVTEAIAAALRHFAANWDGKSSTDYTKKGKSPVDPKRLTDKRVRSAIRAGNKQIRSATIDNNTIGELDGRSYGTQHKRKITLSAPALYMMGVDFKATSAAKIVDGFVEEMADVLVHEAVAHAVPEVAIKDGVAAHEIMKLILQHLAGQPLGDPSKLPHDHTGKLNGTIGRMCVASKHQCKF